MVRTCSIEQAAAILQVSPRSLSDKRYRQRLGLAGRKVGRRLIFTEDDVIRLLEGGREYLAGEGRAVNAAMEVSCAAGQEEADSSNSAAFFLDAGKND